MLSQLRGPQFESSWSVKDGKVYSSYSRARNYFPSYFLIDFSYTEYFSEKGEILSCGDHLYDEPCSQIIDKLSCSFIYGNMKMKHSVQLTAYLLQITKFHLNPFITFGDATQTDGCCPAMMH
jgi:hypothetical protein